MSIVFSIVTALIAALLAHHFASARLKAADLSRFQITAYSDFIAAASQVAVSRRQGSTSSTEVELTALNHAKVRVITCGDAEVVKAVLEFWDQGSTLEREREIIAFNYLVKVMREALGHKRNDLGDLAISDALFVLEPSSYSYKIENACKLDT